MIRHQQVGWLTALIGAYEQEHRWAADPDPLATQEMLTATRSLLARLERTVAPEGPPAGPPADELVDLSEVPF
jgi:hypothetical protein